MNYYRPPRDLWTVCTPYTMTSSPQYSRSISISISISIYLHLQPSVDLPPTFSYVFRALFTSGPRVNTSLAHRALFSSSHMNPSPSPQPARQSSSIFFSTRCNHRGPFPKKDRARNDPSDTHADARRPLHGKPPRRTLSATPDRPCLDWEEPRSMGLLFCMLLPLGRLLLA